MGNSQELLGRNSQVPQNKYLADCAGELDRESRSVVNQRVSAGKTALIAKNSASPNTSVFSNAGVLLDARHHGARHHGSSR